VTSQDRRTRAAACRLIIASCTRDEDMYQEAVAELVEEDRNALINTLVNAAVVFAGSQPMTREDTAAFCRSLLLDLETTP
jgi:hypothetical protein